MGSPRNAAAKKTPKNGELEKITRLLVAPSFWADVMYSTILIPYEKTPTVIAIAVKESVAV